MARRKKGSVFDYEGTIPQEPTFDEMFPEPEAPEQPQGRQVEEDEWNTILEKGEPPRPISEFEEHPIPEEVEQTTYKRKDKRIPVRNEAFMKKVEQAKNNSKLVRNEILGYRSQEVIDEAIRRGAIIKLGNTWAIPYEETLVNKDDKGNLLKEPRKGKRISDNYTKFKEELENGTLKINKKELF